MNRRQLLRGALTLASLPLLIRPAFASDNPKEQRAHLSRAWKDAVTDGRPLLVLVIPADDGDKWVRGQGLGEWLNNASDEQLAVLGQVEVVCATTADLKRLLPGKIEGEPWLFLIEPETATVQAIDWTLPPAAPMPGWEHDDWMERQDRWDEERVSANLAVIDAAARPVIEAATGPVPAGRVTALAQQVRREIIDIPPAGAHWANSGGCGTSIEGVEANYAMACGMGHVPARSRRFLYMMDVAVYRGF